MTKHAAETAEPLTEGEGFEQDILREFQDIERHILRSRRPALSRHVSYEGDEVAALRVQIDERIERLGTGFEDDDEDPILDLIADLVQYRIALWNSPAPVQLVEARWQRDQLDEENYARDFDSQLDPIFGDVVEAEPAVQNLTVVVNL